MINYDPKRLHQHNIM